MERIQFRRDTAANWRTHNPVLAEGELGIETDTKMRKVGDGSTAWNNLDYLAAENIVQELGDSETAVISQKVVTDNIIGGHYREFVETQAYSIGRLVTKDNKLYMFIKPHAAGAWNEDHVREAIIADDCYNIYGDALNLIDSNYNIITGGYYNTSGTLAETDGFCYIEEPVEIDANSTYVYRGGIYGNLALLIYDANMSLVATITSNSKDFRNKDVYKKFTTPYNAKYIKLSTPTSQDSLPLGLFKMPYNFPASEEQRISRMCGNSFKNSYETDSGDGYYTINDSNALVFNSDAGYEYHRFNVIPRTLYKLYSSLGYNSRAPIIVVEGEFARVIYVDTDDVCKFGNYKEVILQVPKGSNFSMEPICFDAKPYDNLGGYTNLLNAENVSNGYYTNGTAFDTRLDFIKAKLRLKAGKTYILTGNTSVGAGSANCSLLLPDTTTAVKHFKLNGTQPYLVYTGVTDLDLCYCSIVGTSDLHEPTISAGVYEVEEPASYDSLFYYRTKSDNILVGWYNVNDLSLNDEDVPLDLNVYVRSTPIKVTPGQKFRYHGAGYKNMAAVLSCDSSGTPDGVLKISTNSDLHNTYVDIDFEIPEDVSYILIQTKICVDNNNTEEYIPEAYLWYLGASDSSAAPKIQWTIPAKIYAIKGQEKSIYFDNIVNRNDDAPAFVLQSNSSFGSVDSRRFYFTPNSTGSLSVRFDAFDLNNNLIGSRTISIEVIDNVLSSQKRICCIGDSITEALNMPYYIEEGLKSALSSGGDNLIFVGTKGGESGMGGKPTKHEGWYGLSYQWLAGHQSGSDTSPFINPDTQELDIQYYRTNKLSLQSNEYIDIVNLAMGFNGTATNEDADAAFSSMQEIIAAFKADNANTKFVVQLVTYPAMGNVQQPIGEQRVNKKNHLYYFRKLCLDAYNNGQDPNIFIGDWGLGYDRWYAYKRTTIKPASYYQSDNIEVVTDRVHPSEDGTKQMGENSMHSILKAMQM